MPLLCFESSDAGERSIAAGPIFGRFSHFLPPTDGYRPRIVQENGKEGVYPAEACPNGDGKGQPTGPKGRVRFGSEEES
jgi:hypothetical protein